MTFNEKLPILVSARVRLSAEQRREIKDAYYSALNNEQLVGQQPHSPAVSFTQTTNSSLERQLGMSRLVMTDLLSSRDSIALPLINKIQKVLGLEVVSREQILTACTGYLDYNEVG